MSQEELARAWDEGAIKASPHGGAYLRSILAENPYRNVTAGATANHGGMCSCDGPQHLWDPTWCPPSGPV